MKASPAHLALLSVHRSGGHACIAVLLVAGWLTPVATAQYQLRGSAGSAAGAAVSGPATMRALVGQAITGHARANEHVLMAGLWHGLRSEAGGGMPAIPAAPELLQPAEGANDLAPPVAFSWSASEGAASYRLQVALEETFETLVLDTAQLATTTFEAADLLLATKYFWRVRAENSAGASVEGGPSWFSTVSPVGAEHDTQPLRFRLDQNYPNPFNPSTTIRFVLAEPGQAQLFVYDVLGRRVTSLVDDVLTAGVHEVVFDAEGLPSGTYVIRLRAGAFAETRTVVLLR